MERTIDPSARIEEAIEMLLLDGLADPDRLTELGRLGARLVLQRAVEEEVEAFLGRAHYERTPDAIGSRNGTGPRRIQTAEGEITLAMPQVRDSLIASSARSSPMSVASSVPDRSRPSSSAPTCAASPTATSRASPVRPAWVH